MKKIFELEIFEGVYIAKKSINVMLGGHFNGRIT
jgi:hypothetical protein